MEARGIGSEWLVEGVKRGSMDMMGDWTLAADKILVF
jgi:sulfur relay (sulfurtransferase) complex TusBCD TusD component (DsrE family)